MFAKSYIEILLQVLKDKLDVFHLVKTGLEYSQIWELINYCKENDLIKQEADMNYSLTYAGEDFLQNNKFLLDEELNLKTEWAYSKEYASVEKLNLDDIYIPKKGVKF